MHNEVASGVWDGLVRVARWLPGGKWIGGAKGAGVLAGAALIAPAAVQANPAGEQVTAGDVNFHRHGSTLTITQGSQHAIISWESFSIDAGELTRFIQPSATSAALNRVRSGNPSQLLGSLAANGQVFLINPNGIIVGQNALINTQSFIASTLDVSDEAFLSSGDLKFVGHSNALVANHGTINALGGDIFLIAQQVENTGTLAAAQGVVGLAAGTEVLLQSSGEQRLFVLAGRDATTDLTGIANSGLIESAQAELHAAGGNIYALAINNAGAIRATGVEQRGGRVLLTGPSIDTSGSITAGNADGSGGAVRIDADTDVVVAGQIDVTGQVGGADGGGVEGGIGGGVVITGRDVVVAAGAAVDASGSEGGTILVGGDIYGGSRADERLTDEVLTNAHSTTIQAGAELRADGGDGQGGNIVVWSDDHTLFEGHLSASGRTDGGFAEVSGKRLLSFRGTVDLSGNTGDNGLLLLDPYNITIQADGNTDGGIVDGEYEAGQDDSILLVDDLVAALESADVLVTTGAGGSQAGDITVADAIAWDSTSSLTLHAANDIHIGAPITALLGGLVLDAGGEITAGAAIDVSLFDLQAGHWVQNTLGLAVVLPDFHADDFRFDPASASFIRVTGGDGSTAAPWQITDVFGLQGMASHSLLGDDFVLVSDIDASGTANWYGEAGFLPIGTAGARFIGSLDGQGHTITGLLIDQPDTDYVGLFGYIDNTAEIHRVGLVGGNVTGRQDVGSLVGWNAGTITESYATGDVVGQGQTIGGLVGRNTGTITESYATGSVEGDSYVGGLIGYSDGSGSTVTQSYATGDVTGREGYVGGLVGASRNTQFIESYATGNVTAPISHVGGLIGYSDVNTTITLSYATGNVTSRGDRIGGLVGGSIGATIDQSYATGNVQGHSHVGGLLGSSNVDTTVTDSYATGSVTGQGQYVGGLIGDNRGAITDSYASGSVTGQGYYVGGLVGYSGGTSINQSYATGSVEGISGVGGLVGYNYDGDISQSYATGSVTGQGNDVGGLIGANAGGDISQSYATGSVTSPSHSVGGLVGNNVSGDITQSYATGNVTGQGNDVGGLIGSNFGSAINLSYYDQTTTGQDRAVGNVPNHSGVTAIGGEHGSPLEQDTYAEWDFANDWFLIQGETRPFLRSEYSTTITNAHQLQLMVMDLGADYTIAADIDLTGVLDNPSRHWNPEHGFVPVGQGGASFTGSLDGQGHTITGLLIDRPDAFYVGLFGVAAHTSEIHRLGLIDVKVAGYEYTGGLIGWNSGGGTITQSYATGNVTGQGNRVGGLVGANNGGSITQSYATGSVTGQGNRVGGLVGLNLQGTITQSYATGSVTGENDRVGGLVGSNAYGTIEHSYASGSVTGQGHYVGGLIGYNLGGTIDQSYATGSVTGQGDYVGGLIGWNSGGGTITQSYATGSVSGHSYIGGLVGWNSAGTITQSYATGSVTGQGDLVGGLIGGAMDGTITHSHATGSVSSQGGEVGGLIGFNQNATISQSYATGSVTGQGIYVGGLVGRNYNADITDSYATGDVTSQGSDVGGLVGHNAVSIIIHPPGTPDEYGDGGTITRSYATGNVTGSGEVGGLVGRTRPNTVISQSYATGSVTGTSKIASTYVGGLVGFVEDGTIEQSYATGSVASAGAVVGGLVGYLIDGSSITESYATGNVTGQTNWVGGLVGLNGIGSSISQSYATGNVTGQGNYVGGLVGHNSGSITQSYATGSVTGSGEVGGLVGTSSSSITQSYATGSVSGQGDDVGGLIGSNDGGTIEQSYYDQATTGQQHAVGNVDNPTGVTAIGGEHGSPLEQDTYAEWDFTDTGDWFLIQGQTRPFLRSEYSTTITNAHQLQLMAMDLGADYTLAADIDLGSALSHPTGMWTEAGFVPIGNSTGSFTGSLDGQGHTITGLTIDRPDANVGLFGYTYGAHISRVGLNDVHVVGGDNVGSLVGSSYTSHITGAWAWGSVSGQTHLGGLIGFSNGGQVARSWAHVDASGADRVGGLVGSSSSTITQSHASGSVMGQNNIGGLIGYNLGTVEQSYATASVAGNAAVGGLVGRNRPNGTITQSYATGSVTGENNIGGLVGQNDHVIELSYYDQATTGQDQAVGNVDNHSGVTAIGGDNDSPFERDTYSQFADFDDVWFMVEGQTRPFLRMEHSTTIANAHQLQLIDLGLGDDYTLAADIDLGSALSNPASMWNLQSGFVPIGSDEPFTGSFDGQGHTIAGLFIERTGSSAALFGSIANARISHVNLVDVDIRGGGFGAYDHHGTGSLVGYSQNSQIAHVSATGHVSGDRQVGGLVGFNHFASSITHASAAVDVTATGSAVGGLVGYNGITSGLVSLVSNITQSHATGDVIGSSYVGGLVGYNDRDGDITGSYATGNVNAAGNYVGGLVGWNVIADITNSYATGDVTTTGHSVGGLVGWNEVGHITRSYATGDVTGQGNRVGGLVGGNSSSIVTHAYATGSVTGQGDYVGGLIGYSAAGITHQSYATGSVTGENHVGGLIGQNDGIINESYATGNVNGQGQQVGGLVGYMSDGIITHSYATGSVTGENNVGGLVGQNDGIINHSYATGSVTGENNVGGLVGQSDGTIVDSYFDQATTGQDQAVGNVDNHSGVTAIGGDGGNPFEQDTYKNFDNFDDVWFMIEGETRPFLRWEHSTTITNAHQLQLMVMDLGADYTIAADIDLGSVLDNPSRHWNPQHGFVPVGDSDASFTGSLDGQGHTITGLMINAPGDRNVGLFGAIVEAAISDLGLLDVDVTGSDYDPELFGLGGLAGYSEDSQITRVFVTGNVSGTGTIGGLVGWNEGGSITHSYATSSVTSQGDYVGGLVGGSENGTITQVYATGNVDGESGYVGGLFGWNDGGTITQAYATGDVTSQGDYVGGLIGWSNGTITDSYATGSVEGNGDVGGLVGYHVDGTITQSHATGNVTGQYDVGGLVGSIEDAAITQSYATGHVTGEQWVGGLVGGNTNTDISQSYATGNVTGDSSVGGLVGDNDNGTITQAYSSGSVTGVDHVGGLIGWNLGTIDEVYTISHVSATGSNVGAIVGNHAGSVTGAYWNADLAGVDNAIGNDTGSESVAHDVSVADLFKQETFADWNFDDVWANADDAAMPYFQWRYPLGAAAVTGTVYDQDGGGLGGIDVDIVFDGVSLATLQSRATGFYYQLFEPGTLESGKGVLAIGNGGNAFGIVNETGGATGLDLFADALFIHTPAAVDTHSLLAQAAGDLTAADGILFTVDDTLHTLDLDAADLIVSADSTYRLDGNVTTQGDITILGHLTTSRTTNRITAKNLQLIGQQGAGRTMSYTGDASTGELLLLGSESTQISHYTFQAADPDKNLAVTINNEKDNPVGWVAIDHSEFHVNRFIIGHRDNPAVGDANNPFGVRIDNTTFAAEGGDLYIYAQASATADSDQGDHYGLGLFGDTRITANSIDLVGYGAQNALGGSHGVLITGELTISLQDDNAAGTITGTGASGGIGTSGGSGVHLAGSGTNLVLDNLAGDLEIRGSVAEGHQGVGITLADGAQITGSTTTADVALRLLGIGGDTGSRNRGVRIAGEGTAIDLTDYSVQIVGLGGNAADSDNTGILIRDDATITLTGDAYEPTLSLHGVGGGAGQVDGSYNLISDPETKSTYSADGVLLVGTTLNLSDVALDITGQSNSQGYAVGVYLIGVTINAELDPERIVPGGFNMTGTGSAGAANGAGVQIWASDLSFAHGDVSITGTGRGGGSTTEGGHLGVIAGYSQLNVAGQGSSFKITGTGGYGQGSNEGVVLTQTDVTTFDAGSDITLIGHGGEGSLGEHVGVRISGSGLHTQGPQADITVNGYGGQGGGRNRGVLIEDASLQVDGLLSMITINGTGGTGHVYDGGLGLHQGVRMVNSTLTATGDGYDEVTETGWGEGISVYGAGGSGQGGNHHGLVFENSTLTTTGNQSSIWLGGNGGNDDQGNHGLLMLDSTVRTTGDASTIALLAGVGTGLGGFHSGILIAEQSSLETTGRDASIALASLGGIGGSHNIGVQIDQSRITTSGDQATLHIGGLAGSGEGGGHAGVHLHNSVLTATGQFQWDEGVSGQDASAIVVQGIGGTGGGANTGVVIEAATISTTQSGAAILVTGEGGSGEGGHHHGLHISGAEVDGHWQNSTLSTQGDHASIQLAGLGGEGGSGNGGLLLTDTRITTAGQGVLVNLLGQAAFAENGSGQSEVGIHIAASEIVSSGAGSLLTLQGVGGYGSSGNIGLLIEESSLTTQADNSGIGLFGVGGAGEGGGHYGTHLVDSQVTVEGSGSMDEGLLGLEIGGGLVEDTLFGTLLDDTLDDGLNLLMIGIGGHEGSDNAGLVVEGSQVTLHGDDATLMMLGIGSLAVEDAGDRHHGIHILAGRESQQASVIATHGRASSAVMVGAGGQNPQGSDHIGLLIEESQLQTDGDDATFLLLGQAGGGHHGGHVGVQVVDSTMQASGQRTLMVIEGHGGESSAPDATSNDGLVFDGTTVTFTGDDSGLLLHGFAGSGDGGEHHGVHLLGSTLEIQGHNGANLHARGLTEYLEYDLGNDAMLPMNYDVGLIVDGQGGSGGAMNHGVVIESSDLTTQGSDTLFLVNGQGGQGEAGNHYGVHLADGSHLSTQGDWAGGLVVGAGGGSSDDPGSAADNRGVQIDQASLTTTGDHGTVGVVGRGGSGDQGGHHGVHVDGGTFTADGDGAHLALMGYGGQGGSGNDGLAISSTTLTLEQSYGASAHIMGVAGSGQGGEHHGVHITDSTLTAHSQSGDDTGPWLAEMLGLTSDQTEIFMATVPQDATLLIAGVGGSGGSGNDGVLIENTDIHLSAPGQADLTLMVFGQGGSGDGGGHHGVHVADDSDLLAAGTDSELRVIGLGGQGGADNDGVVIEDSALTTQGDGAGSFVFGRAGSGDAGDHHGVHLIASVVSASGQGGWDTAVLPDVLDLDSQQSNQLAVLGIESAGLVIAGHGAQGGNAGVLVQGTELLGEGQHLLLAGRGGQGEGGDHQGVLIADHEGDASRIETNGQDAVIAMFGLGGGATGIAGGDNDGLVIDKSNLLTTGQGSHIMLYGHGGLGDADNRMGVYVSGSTLTTQGDAAGLSITGVADPDDQAGDLNAGIMISGQSELTTHGDGSMMIFWGQGGRGDQDGEGNYGLLIWDATLTAVGKGASTSGMDTMLDLQFGDNAQPVTSPTHSGYASIYLVGIGGHGGEFNAGTALDEARITTAGELGGVVLAGQGGSGGDLGEHQGLYAIDTTIRTQSDQADIRAIGWGGQDSRANDGIYLKNTDLETEGDHAAIHLLGQGGAGNLGEHHGMLLDGASLTTHGSGAAIVLGGLGGQQGDENKGILLAGSTALTTNGQDAAITLVGTGGSGGNVQRGIDLQDVLITTTGDHANVRLEGQGGQNGRYNDGLTIDGSTIVTEGQQADIAIDAHGGSGDGDHYGVRLLGSSLTAWGDQAGIVVEAAAGSGDARARGIVMTDSSLTIFGQQSGILLSGTASSGHNGSNIGVTLTNTSLTSHGQDSAIGLTGTGGNGLGGSNIGIYLDADSLITSTATNGMVSLTGVGGVGGSGNVGLHIEGAHLTALGGADSSLLMGGIGGQGDADNTGVLINGGAKIVGDGQVTLFGQGSQTGLNSHGVEIVGQDTHVAANGQNATLNIGGNGYTNTSVGLLIHDQATVSTTGDHVDAELLGVIDVIDTSTPGSPRGVQISDAVIHTLGQHGSLTIRGSVNDDAAGRGVSIDNAKIQIIGQHTELDITGYGGQAGTVISQSEITTWGDNAALNITGHGGSQSGQAQGVVITDGSRIASSSPGSEITIIGNAGDAADDSIGVLLRNMQLDIENSELTIVGRGGGNGTGTGNHGVMIDGANIHGWGLDQQPTISIMGQSGFGTDNNHAVYIVGSDAHVHLTTGGSLSIRGTAPVSGPGSTGSNNVGVRIADHARVTAGGPQVELSIVGEAGGQSGENHGVYLDTGAVVAAQGDDAAITLSIAGTGSGNDADNHGVYLGDDAQVIATGDHSDIRLTIHGTGGGSEAGSARANHGIYVSTTAGVEASGDHTSPTVSLIGTGGRGDASAGIYLAGQADVTGGSLNLVSTSGSGAGANGRSSGVVLDSATLTADFIGIQGTGSSNSEGRNHGVKVLGSSQITAAEQIILIGTGGTGGSVNVGVVLGGDSVLSTSLLNINGNGGIGESDSVGVLLTDDLQIIADEITIIGAGGSGSADEGFNDGVAVQQQAVVTAGALTLTGVGGKGGTDNAGVAVYEDAQLIADTMAITGIGGSSDPSESAGNNVGLWIADQALINAQELVLEGFGGQAGGDLNHGIELLDQANLTAETIKLIGQAGQGDNSLAITIHDQARVESATTLRLGGNGMGQSDTGTLLKAQRLIITGGGRIQLDSTLNDIPVLEASMGAGSLRYVSSGSLALGQAGISLNGDLTLISQAGTLDIASAIYAGSGAVTLAIGQSQAGELKLYNSVTTSGQFTAVGGEHRDTIELGGAYLSAGDPITPLTIDGGAGKAALIVDDSQQTAAQTYQITDLLVNRTTNQPVTVFYVNLDEIQLLAGSGDDTVHTQFLIDVLQRLDGGDAGRQGNTLVVDVLDATIDSFDSPLQADGYSDIIFTRFGHTQIGGMSSDRYRLVQRPDGMFDLYENRDGSWVLLNVQIQEINGRYFVDVTPLDHVPELDPASTMMTQGTRSRRYSQDWLAGSSSFGIADHDDDQEEQTDTRQADAGQ